jgi:hypothetical protein
LEVVVVEADFAECCVVDAVRCFEHSSFAGNLSCEDQSVLNAFSHKAVF